MIINFNDIPEAELKNFNGGEKSMMARRFLDEGRVKILRGRLEPGASIGQHVHDTSSEIMYFLEGKGKVLYQGEWKEIREGLCHYCPKGESHSVVNDGSEDLIFFAVVPEQ